MSLLQKINLKKTGLTTAVLTAMSVVPAFAAEPSPDVTAYQTVLSSLTGAIKPTDVALILGGCVAAGVSFFFLWFGSRKAVGSFIAALTSGKIKF